MKVDSKQIPEKDSYGSDTSWCLSDGETYK